jgi:hypothetical protein
MKLKASLFKSEILFWAFYVFAAFLFGYLALCPAVAFGQTAGELKKIYSSFRLQEVIRIDTSDKELTDKGLFDIHRFAVDREGNIYALNPKNQAAMIFVINKQGKLVRSFARQGQGPGELENPFEMFLTPEENIFVLDPRRAKVSIFSKEGVCLKEMNSPPEVLFLRPLPGGNYVGLESIYGVDTKEWGFALNYYDEGLKKNKELDRLTYANPVSMKTVEATPHLIFCEVSGDRIYSAFPERGYEFLVFDLKGEFLKKITIPYKKSADLKEYKKIMHRDIGGVSRFGVSLIYPKYALPFYSYFTDENGYLFVMTFESGKAEGEYMYDVISPGGKLQNRVSLGPFFWNGSILARVLQGHVYLVREKESGDKEIIVFRIY